MARTPELKVPENEDKELEETAAKLELMVKDSLTSAVVHAKPTYTGPYVSIFLPELEGGGQDGIKVDQYEHVTLANEKREEIYRVLRGTHVDVPVPVFIALKERYPNL